MCMNALLPYMFMHTHACFVPQEARRGHWIPWNQSYGWLWACIWMLGIEPRCASQAISALSHCAISPILFKGNKPFTKRFEFHFVFETRSHHVVCLSLNSMRSTCLDLLGAGIKDMPYLVGPGWLFLVWKFVFCFGFLLFICLPF